MRRLETTLVAVAWAAVVVGLALAVLTMPAYTSTLVDALDVSVEAGLSEEDVVTLATRVRTFVMDDRAEPLPSEHSGRPAFGSDAVSHLIDVRHVIAAARRAAGAAAAALAVWLAWSVARKRYLALGRALTAGGWLCIAIVGLAGLVGLADFGALFEVFHGVFFDPGTWTFPADDLLVQLFPARFWAVSAALWASAVAVGGIVSVVSGRRVTGARASS